MLEQRTCANVLYLLQFCSEPKAHLKTCRHKYDSNNKRQNVKQDIFVFPYSLMCLFVPEKNWRKGVGTKWFVNYIHNILLTNNRAYISFAYLCHIHKEHICMYFNFRAACLSLIILFDHAFPLYGLWIHGMGLCSDSYQCFSRDFIWATQFIPQCNLWKIQ